MVDKRDNFKRLAEARTNKVIHYLNLLGNLSNKSYYEYTKKDIEVICSAIQDELNAQMRRFDSTEKAEKKFRL